MSTTKTMIDRFVERYGENPSPGTCELLGQLTDADLHAVECIERQFPASDRQLPRACCQHAQRPVAPAKGGI